MFNAILNMNLFTVCYGLWKHVKRAPFSNKMRWGRRHEHVSINPCRLSMALAHPMALFSFSLGQPAFIR